MTITNSEFTKERGKSIVTVHWLEEIFLFFPRTSSSEFDSMKRTFQGTPEINESFGLEGLCGDGEKLVAVASLRRALCSADVFVFQERKSTESLQQKLQGTSAWRHRAWRHPPRRNAGGAWWPQGVQLHAPAFKETKRRWDGTQQLPADDR